MMDMDMDMDRSRRLVVGSPRTARRERERDNMKEVSLMGQVGELTTVRLTFANKRSAVLSISSVAIQTHFDRCHGDAAADDADADVPNAFQSSPRRLDIGSRSEASFYVTFAPSRSGIYTGALKLRTSTKKVSQPHRDDVDENDEDGDDELVVYIFVMCRPLCFC